MSSDREIDLRDRLRLAADSLVSDFGDELTAERAEALVLTSAEALLASASVTDFVPILAERRARLALRSGAPAETPLPQPAASPRRVAATTASVPPLFAVPVSDLSRLRSGVAQVRRQLEGWQADLRRR